MASATNTLRKHHAEDGTPLGALLETSTSNRLVNSRNLTNASWAKTNTTVSRTIPGIDGAANSANIVTATANGGFVSQAVAHASATRQSYVWMKRRSGVGAVFISQDGGVTNKDVSGLINSSTWTRVFCDTQTLANPTFRITLAVSGDAVDVDFPVIASTVGSPISSGGAAATRGSDLLAIPASVPDGATLVVFGRSAAQAGAFTEEIYGQVDDGTMTNRLTISRTSSRALQLSTWTGNTRVGDAQQGTLNDDTDFATAACFGNNDFAMARDGGSVTVDTSGAYPTVTGFRVPVTSFGMQGTIKKHALFGRKVASNYLPFLCEVTSNPLLGGGDSYMDGANGVAVKVSVPSQLSRVINSVGVGGATMDDQVAVFQALPSKISKRQAEAVQPA